MRIDVTVRVVCHRGSLDRCGMSACHLRIHETNVGRKPVGSDTALESRQGSAAGLNIFVEALWITPGDDLRFLSRCEDGRDQYLGWLC